MGTAKKQMRKKASAIAKSIFPIGSCSCGGTLFLYLDSKPENRFTIYCTDCNRTYDVRYPKEGPIFFVKPGMQMKVLEEAYGAEEIRRLLDERTEDTNR